MCIMYHVKNLAKNYNKNFWLFLVCKYGQRRQKVVIFYDIVEKPGVFSVPLLRRVVQSSPCMLETPDLNKGLSLVRLSWYIERLE